MVRDEVIDIELGKWENRTPSVMYMELFISQWPTGFWLSSKPKRSFIFFFFISSFGIIFLLGIIEKADESGTGPNGLDGFIPVYFLSWYVPGGKKEHVTGKRMGKETG